MNVYTKFDTTPSASGFFKLPHSIFDDPLLKDLSGEQFRLYLWLAMRAWRFPFSDGTVRASLSYIQMNLPISESTAIRILKVLQQRNLIRLVEKNFHDGNKWFVRKHQPESKSEYKSDSPFCTIKPLSVKQHKFNPNAELEDDVESMPKEYPLIHEYFQKVHPKYLRAEKIAFRMLRFKLEASSLEEIFQGLQNRGTPSGQKCEFPLSYLNKLPQKALEKIIQSEKNRAKIEPISSKSEERFDLHNVAESAFTSAFLDPDQQEAYMEKVRQRFPSIAPRGKLLRLLAVASWNRENQS
jgi:hypothetical protein